MKSFGKLLTEKLSFRGGGQKEMIQGSCSTGFTEIKHFIQEL